MLNNIIKPFFTALGFLTIIPVPQFKSFEEEDFGKAGAYYPLIGLIIGGLVWLSSFLFGKILPPELTALLCLLVWEGLSGFLHLDGLADCGDALLVSADLEKRWQILHDSRIGAFGVIALIFHLGAKYLAIESLSPHTFIAAVITAPVFARFIVLLIARQKLIASSKFAAAFQKGFKTIHLLIALLIPLTLCIIFPMTILLSLVIAVILAFGISRLAYRKLQGINGDVLGMLIEFSELFVLLTFVIITTVFS